MPTATGGLIAIILTWDLDHAFPADIPASILFVTLMLLVACGGGGGGETSDGGGSSGGGIPSIWPKIAGTYTRHHYGDGDHGLPVRRPCSVNVTFEISRRWAAR